MTNKTKDEKKAYHKKYYLDNIERLQALARVRYWSLVYKKGMTPKKKAKKTESRIKIIKGTFQLFFD
jgi:hypothetical protein